MLKPQYARHRGVFAVFSSCVLLVGVFVSKTRPTCCLKLTTLPRTGLMQARVLKRFFVRRALRARFLMETHVISRGYLEHPHKCMPKRNCGARRVPELLKLGTHTYGDFAKRILPCDKKTFELSGGQKAG